MSRYFFSADYHLGHSNIIKYVNRPFKDVEHMNESIIRNHNQRVKEDDIVFHIGDFCFKNTAGGKEGEGELKKAKEYSSQLNGNLIYIKGNHDGNNSLKTILKSAVIDYAGQEIFLVHNPEEYNPKYKINLVGHIHKLWCFQIDPQTKTILINVGCDCWRYMPVTFEEIMKELQKWLKENKVKLSWFK